MSPFDQVTLHTDRLLLRPLHEADATALFRIYSDPRTARYLSHPAWTSLSQAHELLERDQQALPAGEYLELGVERRDTAELIGDCSLFHLKPQCRRAEVGYALAPDAWGWGYMHEALSALLDYGFGALNLNRIEADIDPRNLASARSLERLGFRHEGHLRERWIVDGEVSDTGLYGLLAREWRARSETMHR